MRVSESMRARIWSPWNRFTVTGCGGVPCSMVSVPVSPGAKTRENTVVVTLLCVRVMVKRTSSGGTFGLTMVPESVAWPSTGTVTGMGRPAKAKSAEAVVTKAGRPASSRVAGSTAAPVTAV